MSPSVMDSGFPVCRRWLNGTRGTTTGWLPSCSCDAPTTPATVLDCFAGAGTVGLVADRGLGRDAVLIEISADYAEMARKRINDENPLFADVSIRD